MNPPADFAPQLRSIEISDPRFESEGLRQVTAKSAALGGRADLTLYVPPMATAIHDIPLVILLHGVYGSHWAWTLKGGAHRIAAKLMTAGKIPPMVLAMPSDGLWGDGSGYLAHRTQDFEQWIATEVPALAAKVVPNISAASRCFLAGLSMGGYGALRLGAKYPERFRGVSGHSSITELGQMTNFVEELPQELSGSESDRSVLALMCRNGPRLPPIRFDCGTEDRLLEPNRSLHAALLANGVAHRYEEFPGGHEWSYWAQHLPETLGFFGAILRGP